MQTFGPTLKIPVEGTVRLDPEKLMMMYFIRDAVTLSADVEIWITNTPRKPCVVQLAIRKSIITLDGNTLTFFQEEVPQ